MSIIALLIKYSRHAKKRTAQKLAHFRQFVFREFYSVMLTFCGVITKVF